MIKFEKLTRESLAQKIFESSYRTGEFTLRSGQKSYEYFDKYQFESNPLLLKNISYFMSLLLPSEFDALGALEMGGIPLATAIALTTGKPLCFIRKEAKTYGTCQIAEGFNFKGKYLVLIEDVITTGGQVIESAKMLRDQGAEIDQVICVIDRSEGQHKLLNENGINVRALFTMEELKRTKA